VIHFIIYFTYIFLDNAGLRWYNTRNIQKVIYTDIKMNYLSFRISILTLIPAIALCVFVYYKDKVEKEPVWLLSVLLGAGALVYYPAYLLEGLAMGIIDNAFASHISFSAEGAASYSSGAIMVSHKLLLAFIGISLIEELIKWAVVYLITFRNKNFDCMFDGIVYYVFVSLGFVIAESVRYAVSGGTFSAMMRSAASLPAHMLFAIVAGFVYTVAKTYATAAKKEKAMINEGIISSRRIKAAPFLLVFSFVTPMMIHGIYSFTSLIDTREIKMAYFITVIVMYATCFIITGVISKRDEKNTVIADAVLMRKHGIAFTHTNGDASESDSN